MLIYVICLLFLILVIIDIYVCYKTKKSNKILSFFVVLTAIIGFAYELIPYIINYNWYCQYSFTLFLHETFKPPVPMTHSIFSSWSLEADHHWPNKSSDCSNRWWNISISAFSVPLLSFASCHIYHTEVLLSFLPI